MAGIPTTYGEALNLLDDQARAALFVYESVRNRCEVITRERPGAGAVPLMRWEREALRLVTAKLAVNLETMAQRYTPHFGDGAPRIVMLDALKRLLMPEGDDVKSRSDSQRG